MTKEQDIVERLLAHDLNLSPDWSTHHERTMWIDQAGTLLSEAAQTIAALRAERDKTKAELARRTSNPADYRYWEGRWRDTQAECDTAIRERDELRKALEPFVKDLENWTDENGWTEEAPKNDRICDWFGPSDFRRARASSNREGGE